MDQAQQNISLIWIQTILHSDEALDLDPPYETVWVRVYGTVRKRN